MNKPFTPLTF